VITFPGAAVRPGPFIDDRTPTLQWHSLDASVTDFAIAISRYPYGEANVIYSSDWRSGRPTAYTVTRALEPGTRYRWRLEVRNAAITHPRVLSNILYFQTRAVEEIREPVIVPHGGDLHMEGFGSIIEIDKNTGIAELTIRNHIGLWARIDGSILRERIGILSVKTYPEWVGDVQKRIFNEVRWIPGGGSATYRIKLGTLQPGDIFKVDVDSYCGALQIGMAGLSELGWWDETAFKTVVESLYNPHLRQADKYMQLSGRAAADGRESDMLKYLYRGAVQYTLFLEDIGVIALGGLLDKVLGLWRVIVDVLRAGVETIKVMITTGVFFDMPSIRFEVVSFAPPSPEVVLSIGIVGEGTVNPGPGELTFTRGGQVNISAIPASGWAFSSWIGNTKDIANIHDPTTTITMNNDNRIRAHFTRILAISLPNFRAISLASPGDLRIYDLAGRVTGLVDGRVKEGIPNSFYSAETKTVTVFDPEATGPHRYQARGIEEGKFGLTMMSVDEEKKVTTLAVEDRPISLGMIYQYIINWDLFAEVDRGATVEIDADADGVFEKKIELQLPRPSFVYSPLSPTVDQIITFDASQSYDPDGNIESFRWAFGDGVVGTGKTAGHSFASPGNYTVTLTVTDNHGVVISTSRIITIMPPALTGITVMPPQVTLVVGATQQFTTAPVPAGARLGTVTWTATPTGSGIIDATGLFRAITAGTVGVTAEYAGITGSAIVTVTAAPPQLHVAPTTISDSLVQGTGLTTIGTVNVTNPGGGTLSWSAVGDRAWIEVTPSSGTTTTETDSVTVQLTTAGLALGTHTGQITFTGAGTTRTVTVNLTVIDRPVGTRPDGSIATAEPGLLVVYPNPAEATVRVVVPGKGVADLKVWSVSSVLVLSRTVEPGTVVIEVGNLQTGIYLITLSRRGRMEYTAKLKVLNN